MYDDIDSNIHHYIDSDIYHDIYNDDDIHHDLQFMILVIVILKSSKLYNFFHCLFYFNDFFVIDNDNDININNINNINSNVINTASDS